MFTPEEPSIRVAKQPNVGDAFRKPFLETPFRVCTSQPQAQPHSSSTARLLACVAASPDRSTKVLELRKGRPASFNGTTDAFVRKV